MAIKRQKHAKNDFEISMLPHNRFQLFGDVYRNRPSLIFGLGLILLVFCLPFAIVSSILHLKIYSINQALAEGIISEADGAKEVFALINAQNLALIPCFAIIAFGIAGCAGVFRKLVWQDGILLFADFKQSLKENFGRFSAVAIILGILNCILQYCIRATYFDNGVAMQASIVASVAAFAVSLFIAPIALVQNTVYNLPFVKQINNAFLLSMRMPHYSLCMLFVNVAPYLLLFVPNKYTYIIFTLLLPVLILPAQILINMLVSDSVLDRFINKENFPTIYKKGMYNNASDNDTKSE